MVESVVLGGAGGSSLVVFAFSQLAPLSTSLLFFSLARQQACSSSSRYLVVLGSAGRCWWELPCRLCILSARPLVGKPAARRLGVQVELVSRCFAGLTLFCCSVVCSVVCLRVIHSKILNLCKAQIYTITQGQKRSVQQTRTHRLNTVHLVVCCFSLSKSKLLESRQLYGEPPIEGLCNESLFIPSRFAAATPDRGAMLNSLTCVALICYLY
ncbi:unnamed protein product [Calypogeia fissa]